MNARHVRRAGARRRALGLAVVGAAAGVLGVSSTGLAVPQNVQNDQPEKEKVTFCHATDSLRNPYVVVTTSENGLNGHKNHVDRIENKKFRWGDVIPPTAPIVPDGINWPEGEGLLKNGCAPLGIVKTGDATVLPGGVVKYTMTVTNVGLVPLPAQDIYVKDLNPKVQVEPPATRPKWLAPGEQLVWTGTRSIKNDLRKCGRTYPNTAIVDMMESAKAMSRRKAGLSVNEEEKDPKPASSTFETKVICPLDVAITKTSTQTGVEPGGTITYTVRVTNPGPIPLPTSFLTVADPGATTLTPPAEMPKELKQGEFLDWTATKVLAADNALCNTNAENTASVTVMPPVNGQKPTAKRQNGGSWMPNYTSWPKDPVTATATPILISGGTCPPVTPSSTPVSPAAAPVSALRPAGPALSVEKTGPARALRGGFASYQVTVTNTGGATATGVTLSDTPARAMRWRAVPAGSTVSGTTATWAIGDLAAGQSVSKVVRFRMSTSASGRVCNTAVAAATGIESVRDRACTTIVAARRPATPVTG